MCRGVLLHVFTPTVHTTIALVKPEVKITLLNNFVNNALCTKSKQSTKKRREKGEKLKVDMKKYKKNINERKE